MEDIESFVTFLTEEESKAEDNTLEQERVNAIEFYNGEPFGDEEDGRSQVVTRDVAEVVDGMVTALLETMISGDKVVEFDCPEPEQQPQVQPGQPQPPKQPTVAEQATAYVMREFHQGQPGYAFLHDWIKAGLLEKTSVAKVCVVQQPPRRVEMQVSAEGLAMLAQQDVQPVAAEQQPDGSFAVAVLEPQPPRFRDYVSPNEETRIAQDARALDEECVYLGFARQVSLSELARRGFVVDDIADDATTYDSDMLAQARNTNSSIFVDSSRTGANRKVWYHEEYSLYDFDGDGIAERLLSHRVGNQVLRNKDGSLAIEAIDDHPGVVWCPFPMQHRIVGQSLADKVMDIQRTSSVLMRQALDNIYQSNAPRWSLNEQSIGDTTIDDLLTVRPGGLVRWRGSAEPKPIEVPFVAAPAFEALEILRGEKESRTGITRLNQGIDADALNKTATGTAMMMQAGQQIELYIARNFAEAFARLMLKKYQLIRKFGRPLLLKIDGALVNVDPRTWPEVMFTKVRVGLGSGNKDQRVQARTDVLQMMSVAMDKGLRIVSEENVYNMLKGVITDGNLGHVNDYLTDPATLGPPDPKPDPKSQEVQAKALLQAEQQKSDDAQAQRDHDLKVMQLQQDGALKQQALDYDLQAKREAADQQAQLAREKADFEAGLAQQTADRNFALAQEEMAHRIDLANQQHQAKIAQNRPGGDLDA
jgi:hypothetical protein